MDMGEGAVITVEYIHAPHSATHKMYRLSSTNRALRADLVQRMLADGLIEPNEDGLPGIGESQTYRMVRASAKET